MKTICAWCKKKLPDKEPLNDDRLDHGMCEECGKGLIADVREAVADLTVLDPG